MSLQCSVLVLQQKIIKFMQYIFFAVIFLVFCFYAAQHGCNAVFANFLRYGAVYRQNLGGAVLAQCSKSVPETSLVDISKKVQFRRTEIAAFFLLFDISTEKKKICTSRDPQRLVVLSPFTLEFTLFRSFCAVPKLLCVSCAIVAQDFDAVRRAPKNPAYHANIPMWPTRPMPT